MGEKVEVVKEQVNLDSGNCEKWSEVEERELVDLTGNYAEEIIDLSSDDESCDKFKQSNVEVNLKSINRETNDFETKDVYVESKKGNITAIAGIPGVEKLAKRKLNFGSEGENEKSEVLIQSLMVQMESIKDIIDQTAQAFVNTEDLSLKRKNNSENIRLEGNTKRV